MKRVNAICEGPTEELFVNQVLGPHLLKKGIHITARNLGTGNQYQKLRRDILQWMKSDTTAYVTTLIDLYGMNRHFPGYLEHKGKPPLEKVKAIEAAVKADIDREGLDERQFIPYFQLHEFEALLFSEPEILEEWLQLDRDIKPGVFKTIRNEFQTPEYINDSPHTAPSKRILSEAPSFSKVSEGVLIAEDIGLSKIRESCEHFNEWVATLEKLEAYEENRPNSSI